MSRMETTWGNETLSPYRCRTASLHPHTLVVTPEQPTPSWSMASLQMGISAPMSISRILFPCFLLLDSAQLIKTILQVIGRMPRSEIDINIMKERMELKYLPFSSSLHLKYLPRWSLLPVRDEYINGINHIFNIPIMHLSGVTTAIDFSLKKNTQYNSLSLSSLAPPQKIKQFQTHLFHFSKSETS